MHPLSDKILEQHVAHGKHPAIYFELNENIFQIEFNIWELIRAEEASADYECFKFLSKLSA